MDKIVIQLFADILYIKGIICFEEMQEMLEMRTPSDVEKFTDKLIRGDFNAYRRGEIYSESKCNPVARG